MIWALAQTEKVREIAEWPAGECRCRPRPNNLRKCGGKCSGGCSANVRKMVGTSSAAWWARGGGEHVREMLGECSENIRKFKEHAPKYRGPGAFARLLPYPDSPRPLTEIDRQSKPFTISPEAAEAACPTPPPEAPTPPNVHRTDRTCPMCRSFSEPSPDHLLKSPLSQNPRRQGDCTRVWAGRLAGGCKLPCGAVLRRTRWPHSGKCRFLFPHLAEPPARPS